MAPCEAHGAAGSHAAAANPVAASAAAAQPPLCTSPFLGCSWSWLVRWHQRPPSAAPRPWWAHRACHLPPCLAPGEAQVVAQPTCPAHGRGAARHCGCGGADRRHRHVLLQGRVRNGCAFLRCTPVPGQPARSAWPSAAPTGARATAGPLHPEAAPAAPTPPPC